VLYNKKYTQYNCRGRVPCFRRTVPASKKKAAHIPDACRLVGTAEVD